jgi:serine/threonine-protein kinase
MARLGAGDHLDRYVIREQISLGERAIYYLATDAKLERNVVLGFAKDSADKLANLSLVNEARALAGLQHPSILNVFDIGEYKGSPYVVLEHVDGGTVWDLLQDETVSLPRYRLIEIMIGVANTVDFIHRRGYLHRNIKPEIILIDRNGEPRLSGFEVAIQAEDSKPASIAGTHFYMAPEQFRDDIPLGPETDVYGLGATLYRVLTGKAPFPSRSHEESLKAKTSHDPAAPSSIDASISHDLGNICLKSLAKNPKDRYATADLFAKDLQALQKKGEPEKQHRVFVSHSAKDREFVEKHIINLLEKNGIKTWYSKLDIQTASEWERSIVRGLESSNWFLIAMSPQSVGSEWVKDELHWAIDNRRNRIIPVLIDDCNLRDLHIRMARLQYVDFRNPTKDARTQLLKSFEVDVEP